MLAGVTISNGSEVVAVDCLVVEEEEEEEDLLFLAFFLLFSAGAAPFLLLLVPLLLPTKFMDGWGGDEHNPMVVDLAFGFWLWLRRGGDLTT